MDDAKTMIRYLNEQIATMIAQAPERFVGLGAVPLQDIDSTLQELEFIVKMGAAVFVHALRPAGEDRIVGAFPEQAVCFPGDIALAAASMITGGIAARHPKLRIAFSHGGGAMSMLLPRLEHAWKMFPKAKESLSESPAATAKRFYYDDLVFSPSAIKFLLETFGESQIVLGTDYPFALCDGNPLGTLEQTGFTSSTIAKITSTNAKRFLGLK